MSKHKLLLADDSITIQKVVNLTFADEGIEVTCVGDGDAAMRKINESAPDLVMADVNMPGLNGYQICENVKQNQELTQIPVILLVGSFEPFDETEAERVGADDYMTKPFQSIRQLVNKVSDLLERGDERKRQENNGYAVRKTVDEDQDFVRTMPDLNEHLAGDDEMIETERIGSTAETENESGLKVQNEHADSAEAPENAAENHLTSGAFETESLQTENYEEFSTKQSVLNDADQTEETTASERQDAGDQTDEVQTAENQTPAIYDFAENFEDDALSEPETLEKTAENEYQGEIVEAEIIDPDALDNQSAQDLPQPSDEITEHETEPETVEKSSASVSRFEELDLLELPPFEKQKAQNELTEIADAPVEKDEVTDFAETSRAEEVSETVHAAVDTRQNIELSPETIEAIAQRVVEMLAEKFFDKQL